MQKVYSIVRYTPQDIVLINFLKKNPLQMISNVSLTYLKILKNHSVS